MILYTPLCDSALKRKFSNFFYLFSQICIFIFSHTSITTCTQILITVIRLLNDGIDFIFEALYTCICYFRFTLKIDLYKIL